MKNGKILEHCFLPLFLRLLVEKIACSIRGESTNAIMTTKYDINVSASGLLGKYMNLIRIAN